MNSAASDPYALFEHQVIKHFHFLEVLYSFRRRDAMRRGLSMQIRYESPVVFADLFYGPPAYEVELSFGRIGVDDTPSAYSFGLGDLLQRSSCAKWEWEPVRTDAISSVVAEYARLLRECGTECLSGNPLVFEQMKRARDSAVKGWIQAEKEMAVRKAAEVAWGNKDFGEVRRLYDSIRDHLTPPELDKLGYANRRLDT